MAAIDMGSAMKLLHSSNAKANEVQQDPLVKDVLSQLRIINQKTKQINDAVRGGDKDKAEQLRKDIQTIREDLKKNSEVSDEILDSQDSAKAFLQEKVLESMQNQLAGLTEDIVGELVAMLGKSRGKGGTGDDSEENIMMVVTGAIRNAGIKNQIDAKTIVNFLKAMQGDISTSNAGIRDIIKNNNYVSNVVDDILDGANKFQKKLEKWKTFMANPLGFIKPMFQTVGKILGLIFKTIIPTLVAMSVSLFTVVLPIVLLIIGVILLVLFILYALKVGFWKALKNVATWVWDFIVEKFIPFLMEHPIIGALISGLVGLVSFFAVGKAFSIFMSGVNGMIKVVNVIAKAAQLMSWFIKIGFKAVSWGIQAAWWTTQKLWHGGMWAAQKAWQGAGMIWTLVKGIGTVFAAAFSWILSAGIPFLVSILAAIPIIGWIILAIGAIVAFVWFFREEIWAVLQPVLSWIWDSLKVAWNFYSAIIGEIYDWVIGVFKSAWEGVKKTLDWIWGSVEKAWTLLSDMPSALMKGFNSALSGLGDAFNPFNWFAKGGIVTGPTKAIIGEAGPEAVIPLEGKGKTTLTSLLTDFFNEFLKPVVDYVMNTLKDLINIIVGGIEKVFNIVEKVFNFVFDIFKPYMPILQSVLDAIYSVVYSIISGLSQLPSWLGGEFFASMLNSMTPPKKGGSGTAKPTDDKTLLLSMLSGTISDEPVLSVVGQNKAEIKKFDSSKIPMFPSTLTQLGKYIANASQSIDVPEYAKNLQEGIREIGDSIDEVADKLSSMEKNILGAVGNSGSKVVTQDKQLELAKLMGRNSYNGGKV
jgi:hypothetical protein